MDLCALDPCAAAACPANPSASCRRRACGACEAVFVADGMEVACAAGGDAVRQARSQPDRWPCRLLDNSGCSRMHAGPPNPASWFHFSLAPITGYTLGGRPWQRCHLRQAKDDMLLASSLDCVLVLDPSGPLGREPYLYAGLTSAHDSPIPS